MLERISKAASATEVVGLGRLLTLEGFHQHLESEVRRKLTGFDIARAGKQKEDTDELLTALATHAFRKGCSFDDTQSIATILPQGNEAIRRWILEALPEQEGEYDCVLAICEEDDQTESAVRSVCARLGVERASPKIPGLPDGERFIYFRGKRKGWRAFDATEALRTELRSSLNLLALYRQKAAPLISEKSWIVQEKTATEVPPRAPSFWNLHPRREAVSLAGKAAAALADRRGEHAILAALDLHNVALSMTDHRLRLVNLWSGLECLSSLVDGDSIISRVADLTCPILTWRKPEKVVRYLAISIHYWLKQNPAIDRTQLPFPLGFNDSVAAEHILTLLTKPKDSGDIRKLLNAVSGHPLLVFRVNQAWKIFHESTQLESGLRASAKRLEWHLWRIYRARNLLVHQGVEPECLPQLANNLQQYLSWTLSRLLHGLTFGERWTGRDSLNFWKSKSDHLLSSLIQRPDLLTLADLFPEEVKRPDARVYPVEANSGQAIEKGNSGNVVLQ
jgi:hypothetical protein